MDQIHGNASERREVKFTRTGVVDPHADLWSNVFLHSSSAAASELDESETGGSQRVVQQGFHSPSSQSNGAPTILPVTGQGPTSAGSSGQRCCNISGCGVVSGDTNCSDAYQAEAGLKNEHNGATGNPSTGPNSNSPQQQPQQQEQPARPDSLQMMEPNDPYLITQQKITPSLINTQLKLGPLQPSPNDYHYPKTQRATSESLLCFNVSWYERKLSDGSTQPRAWLSYSKWLNKAFCVYCMLFGAPGGCGGGGGGGSSGSGGPGSRLSESWTRSGWDTWNNGSRDIRRHEESPQHRAAELAKVRTMATMPHNNQAGAQSAAAAAIAEHNHLFQTVSPEVLGNRKLAKMVLDFLVLCAGFQTDWERVAHSGTFTKVVQVVGQYDPSIVAGLVARARNNSNHDDELDFVGDERNRHRLATALCETLSERLAAVVRRRRCFSLVLETVAMPTVATVPLSSAGAAGGEPSPASSSVPGSQSSPTASTVSVVIIWIRYLTGETAAETDVAQGLLDIVTVSLPEENIAERVLQTLHQFGLDESNLVSFCCHASSAASFVSRLGPGVSVWPPPSPEILALVLEQATSPGTGTGTNSSSSRLSACLGMVQQLAAFWTHSIERERFLCELLGRTPGSIGTGGIDDVLDLLVDRYGEMICAFDRLAAAVQLGPLDSWLMDSVRTALANTAVEAGVRCLRRLVGLLRPALSCQQLGRVYFLQQMRSRLAVEAGIDPNHGVPLNGATVPDDGNCKTNDGAPPAKMARPSTPEAVGVTATEDGDVDPEIVDLARENAALLSNAHRLVSELYSDRHLALVTELSQFTGSALEQHQPGSSGLPTEQSVAVLCQLARLDPRSVVREMADFLPIYREHRAALFRCLPLLDTASVAAAAAVADFSLGAGAIFPGMLSGSSSTTCSLGSPTDTFLGPLRLISEFTSFPALLGLYKTLAVLPLFEARPEWTAQRRRLHLSLQHCRLGPQRRQRLDEFARCSLMLTALLEEDRRGGGGSGLHGAGIGSLAPLEGAVIDKLASYSPGLRKALSLQR